MLYVYVSLWLVGTPQFLLELKRKFREMMAKKQTNKMQTSRRLEADVLQVPWVNQKLGLWHTVVCALPSFRSFSLRPPMSAAPQRCHAPCSL